MNSASFLMHSKKINARSSARRQKTPSQAQSYERCRDYCHSHTFPLWWIPLFQILLLALHLVINDKGEILNFVFTTGGVDDREPLKEGVLLKNIKGKLFGDKGYIGKTLFESLFVDGIQLFTKVKNNMKNSLMSISDTICLRKRALIETVNDELKNIAQIEDSRHRSFNNFIANALSAIAAYCFFEKKPAIDLEFINDGQLSLF